MGGVFGAVFAGIGLTVLGFLWGAPWNEFGSPPLFFRIFGSFIAIAFVAVGGMTLVGAITGRMPGTRIPDPGVDPLGDEEGAGDELSDSGDGRPARGGYACPRCGGPLGPAADVSPSGDVKCGYCNTWFNIHRQDPGRR